MSKPVVIIGATGGTGSALARKLAEQGRDLFLIGRDEAATEQLAGELGCDSAIADVTDEDAVRSAVEKADQGEGLAGLAYCVGSILLKPFKALSHEDYEQTFRLNFYGAVHALNAAEKPLKAGRGSVVLFSTIAVQQGFIQHAAIASAKGAIEGLTRSLAAEWAPDVRVNAIAPSLTDTKMAEKLTSSEQMAKGIAAMHAVPRLGKPEDHAHMAAFLLSEQSGWITGQVMHVDGGRSSLRVKG